MKRVLIVIPAVIAAYLILVQLWSHHKEARIADEINAVRAEKLPQYAAFLKPGMTRFVVYRELKNRDIHFEQARDLSYGSNQILLIKRMSSAVFYCSFEDIGVRMIFRTDGEEPSVEGPQLSPSQDDKLRGLDVYGQLMDCL